MRRRIASAARFSQYALPHRSPSKFHTSQCKDNQESKEAGFVRATGIVRRIDELGRVVIPKEIRRTLRIREGDPPLTTLELSDPPTLFRLLAQVIDLRGAS